MNSVARFETNGSENKSVIDGYKSKLCKEYKRVMVMQENECDCLRGGKTDCYLNGELCKKKMELVECT